MTTLLLLALACGGPAEPGDADPAAQTTAETTAPATEAAAADAAASVDWKHFGDPFTLEDGTITAATLLDDPDAFVGKNVRVTGEVADVCQKKGCWMVVQDDKARTMRVTMKGHSWSVDMDSTGALCDMEGTVMKKEPNPRDAVHFASESARPEKAPEGEGVKPTYEIEVTGVSIKKQS